MASALSASGILARRRPPNANAKLLKWLVIAVGGMVGVLLTAVLLLLFGIQNGPVGLLIGLVCATLPVPIYMSMLLWIDRFEPEPPWLLAFTFLWGAVMAPFFAALTNTLVNYLIAAATGDPVVAAKVMFSISAPISEESMKASVLFILFFWRKTDFDGVVDGIVYAGMAALGFAMTENIQYYGNPNYDKSILVLRGVMTPFAHPLFTSMTGIALGISRESRNMIVKWIAPPCGLALAIALHSIWNLSTFIGDKDTQGLWFFVVYFLLMVPLFFGVLGIIVYGLIREGRMVRRNLAPEVANGTLTPVEVKVLCSVHGRFGASARALMSSGVGGWIARRRFHETASHLAFHRNRIECGTLECNTESTAREEQILALLLERKSKLR
jgi:RsiW-degrading membrane proteinase PrsW (M82 family)